MADEIDAILADLEGALRIFEGKVPAPQRLLYKDGFVVRYRERTPLQALVLKFARQVSGLNALKLLMESGFCQEQGVIQRTLDEFGEDIMFLSMGLSRGPWTKDHDLYLKHFWADYILGEDPGHMVPRKKIRAYNVRAGGLPDTSSADAVGKQVFKAYSGYVHGAAVNSFDMCLGPNLQFQVRGMQNSPLYHDHMLDLWNYLYRGVSSASFVAVAIGDHEISEPRYRAVKDFESRFGHLIFPDSP